jgi:hypothetical protein
MIELPNITFVAVDGRQSSHPRSKHYSEFNHLDWCIKYAEYANKYFKFGRYLIVTPDSKKYKHDFIEFKHTIPFGYKGYSHFMVVGLNSYIKTDFCLVYQSDGCIINPSLWDSVFLEYDYIGAPWGSSAPLLRKHRKRMCMVGNGGFSLRSKKFLEVSSRIGFCNTGEDIFLMCKNYDYLIDNGIKIPSCEIARKFSVEYPLDDDHTTEKTFGFHKAKYDHSFFLDSYRTKVSEEINDASKTN